MEVTYGVLWREGEQERSAQLAMRDDALVLTAHGREPRRIPLAAIEWLEIRPPLEGGRERIVVKPFGGGELELESVVDRWILHDLSRHVLRAAYGRGEGRAGVAPGARAVTSGPDRGMGTPLLPAHPFDVDGARNRLAEAGGGYEIVHASPGLEVGVYVLVAPEPDRQQPHEDDEIYVVLDGTGVLEVEGKPVDLRVGHAVFVPAGADHRFTAYEQLAVLVIFERR